MDVEIRGCRRLARLVDHVVVHCEEARREVIASYRIRDVGKVRVVPHGAFDDGAARRMDMAAVRASLGIEPGAFVFLFFGLIRRYKGIEELLSAFSRLNEDDVVLLVAGRCDDPEL